MATTVHYDPIVFASRPDTYTVAGNGATIDVSSLPLSVFAVQVKGTGAAASAWNVRLEGSLNNTEFSTILTHTEVTGDGVVLYSGSTLSPSLYVRSRVASITLGSATDIVVTILGTQ